MATTTASSPAPTREELILASLSAIRAELEKILEELGPIENEAEFGA